MGNPQASYIGINISGQNNTVQYNTVDTTGYVGIFFLGGPNLIKNNTVDYFCYLKDDGGGIYTCAAAIDGTDKKSEGIAMGIYLDENTGMIEVSGNTVAHCTTGIFLQDAHEVVVRGNTLYDNGSQISVRHALAKGALRNNEISGNTAVAARKDQTVLLLSSAVPADVSSFTRIHDNSYSAPSGGVFYKTVVHQNNQNVQDKGALGDWQSKYGKDVNSVQSTSGGTRFEYNAGKTAKSISLDAVYKDAGGKTYQGQVTLDPYSSKILVRQ
jgi:parallel beta-helix repeat protein